MLWPHPITCTACLSTWQTMPQGIDPRRFEIGMLIVCGQCGHCMKMAEGWRLTDLTPDEAVIVQGHWNFPNIRAMQERVFRARNLWG